MSAIISPEEMAARAAAIPVLRLLLRLTRQVGEVVAVTVPKEHEPLLMFASSVQNKVLRDEIVTALNRFGVAADDAFARRCEVGFVVLTRKNGRVCVRCELDEKHEGAHEAPVVLAGYLED